PGDGSGAGGHGCVHHPSRDARRDDRRVRCVAEAGNRDHQGDGGAMSNAMEARAAPRIDAHQHFIDYTPEDYPWIDDRMQTLRRVCLPADLKPLLDDLSFDGCIAVQARQSLKETEWLLRLAELRDWIR